VASDGSPRSVLAIIFLALACAGAPAGESVVDLADARVRFDDSRWRATEEHGRIGFTSVGEKMRLIDPVELQVRDDGETCADLALQAFALGAYDTTGLAPAPATIGGIAGERFSAHTNCRNATPRGVIICARHRGRAYLLQSLNPGYTGGNLFSDIDPLAEIAGSIRFVGSKS